MEKILILVVDAHVGEGWLEVCIKMLQCFKPLIHIMSPIDRHTVARAASNEGVKDAEVRERLLHEAYTNLYHLEDTFSKQGLQATIAVKEMTLPEELLGEIKRINPEMLVVIGKIDSQIFESLYSALHVPVLLLPTED